MSKMLYCPVCGKILSRINKKCPRCNSIVTPVESLHDSTYYRQKSEQIYGLSSEAFKILVIEEASKSILFDKKKSIVDIDWEKGYPERKKSQKSSIPLIQNKNTNIPQCPTCQSTNIKKISTTKRAAHGYLFGIFSKTAFSQFECKNCGYKW